MHLAADKASELFGHAAEGFRGLHNSDLEKSMHEAAIRALQRLRTEEFRDWFDDWQKYLTLTPTEEVFAGGDIDPVALEYDDDRFRALWWTRMEAALIGWRSTEQSSITRLNLERPATLPEPLRTYLRDRLPEAMQVAHAEVLRDTKLERSWIAFQERVYGEMLNRLDRIEGKIDLLLALRQAETVWTIPRTAQHFQERPDLIGQIEHALQQRSVTALTALHGLGGIGKTQLARHFAELHRKDYKLGMWVEAESDASVLAGFSGLAPLLGLPVEQDEQATAARVMNELSAREPWLVIFDNAVAAETLRPYVARLSGLGHVLITSRSTEWDGLARSVSVTQWSIEESARFLLERTGQKDEAAARELARELDGLALALEHAAAYMLAGVGMSLVGYWAVWREKLHRAASKGHDYPRSVAAALGLSIDAAANESGAAYDLLCLFAWLAPDRIPRKELLEAGAAKLPEALGKAFADRDLWNGVLGTLGRYSLVRLEAGGYAMHCVVQQVVRDRGETHWLAAACDLLDAAFPFDSDEPNFWEPGEALLPHARVIREHVRQLAEPASLGRLLSQAAIYLQVRGLYGATLGNWRWSRPCGSRGRTIPAWPYAVRIWPTSSGIWVSMRKRAGRSSWHWSRMCGSSGRTIPRWPYAVRT